MLRKRGIASRSVNELIRSKDKNEVEIKYFKRNLNGRKDIIDFGIRKAINNISKSIVAIK